MSSFRRREHARARERKLARRRNAPPRKHRSAASGMYAAALFVLLILVLLFMRNYSGRVAKAFVDATESRPTEPANNQPLTSSTNDAKHIHSARSHLWQAIDHAQRKAIERLAEPNAQP